METWQLGLAGDNAIREIAIGAEGLKSQDPEIENVSRNAGQRNQYRVDVIGKSL